MPFSPLETAAHVAGGGLCVVIGVTLACCFPTAEGISVGVFAVVCGAFIASLPWWPPSLPR